MWISQWLLWSQAVENRKSPYFARRLFRGEETSVIRRIAVTCNALAETKIGESVVHLSPEYDADGSVRRHSLFAGNRMGRGD
jgi:hypothetical protein